ncbi:MAG: ribonuclease activity regulator RraA, partial [Chloroflexi bacterium]|nr:ribonuclease activity regulator RraA [Chloroflexota bacterium]
MTRPYEPLSAAVLDELRGVSTATLTYYLYKRGLRNVFMQGVASLTRGETLVGQAFTLRFIPLREDKASPSVLADPSYPQRLAIETVEPGDVLVMDARGDTRAGTLGDILVARIRARGAAGVVTDGAVRDALAIAEQELPVYCGGAHAAAHVAVHMA